MAENGLQPLIKLDGVTKVFLTDEVETHALVGHPGRDRQGRVRRDRRAVGLRQIDAAVDPRPARLADRRLLFAQQPAGRGAGGLRARACPQPRDRLHLPELQPDWRSHGVRERRAAAHLPRDARRRAQAARRTPRSSASAWRTARSTFPASCPAVSSSASPSPAPSPASRSSCWPTSRPATWIRAAAKR